MDFVKILWVRSGRFRVIVGGVCVSRREMAGDPVAALPHFHCVAGGILLGRVLAVFRSVPSCAGALWLRLPQARCRFPQEGSRVARGHREEDGRRRQRKRRSPPLPIAVASPLL